MRVIPTFVTFSSPHLRTQRLINHKKSKVTSTDKYISDKNHENTLKIPPAISYTLNPNIPVKLANSGILTFTTTSIN